MEYALSVLTLFYDDLRLHCLEIIGSLIKRIIKLLLFLMYLVVGSITRLLAWGKSRERCSKIDNELLFLPANALLEKIRRKEVKSEEIVGAYIERCKLVNPIINAIVEERFEAALDEAKEVDRAIQSGLKSQEQMEHDTPLLGIPITVKESIAVFGMSHNVGLKRTIPLRAKQDAEVVKRIRKAGGIPLLVSNTPELCMCWETYNNVTGATRNPYDSRRTSGGSSGGEAALLGAGASILSLSSDIGGSGRLPAMFCGVFGHKPTPGWISTIGHRPDCKDKNWTKFFTISPMVRYASDLPLLLKIMCQSKEALDRVDQKVDLQNIKFFCLDDACNSVGVNDVGMDVKLVIDKLINHLEEKRRIKVRKVHLSAMKYSLESATSMLMSINGADSIFSKPDNPKEWKSVFLELLRYLCGKSNHIFMNVCYGILKKCNDLMPQFYHKLMTEKNVELQGQVKELLGDNGVLIHPTFIGPAHYPYEIYPYICNVNYMMIFNSLGLPVTQCPMGLNKDGLPIGLQIVANPDCDHLTIAVAQEIEKAFGGWQEPSNDESRILT